MEKKLKDQSFFQKLKDAVGAKSKALTGAAINAYRSFANALAGRAINGNEFMRENKDRLFSTMQPRHLGRLTMFYYDPKHKDTLPYYDRFPLIIPIELYPDGFLGLNLHYIPAGYRAILMDSIMNNIIRKKHLDETKRIQISYQLLSSVTRNRLFIPCIKRYLYSNLRSRLFLVDPKDWNVAIFMPTERWAKGSKKRVHMESMQKIRRY